MGNAIVFTLHLQSDESSVDPEETLPEWLVRPGASEAVVVGADIRSRYSALKMEVQDKADQVISTVFPHFS